MCNHPPPLITNNSQISNDENTPLRNNLFERISKYRNDHLSDINKINIINDDNNSDEFNKLLTSKSGGELTYIDNASHLSAHSLKEVEFDTNKHEYSTFGEKQNFIIIGAGPIGLYMSILLKLCIPDINVVILEGRGENGKRKLERQQIVRLNIQFNLATSVFEKYKIEKDNFLSDEFINLISDKFVIHDDSSKWNEIINSYRNISLNMLEYFLARKAQTLGVNIIHGYKIDDFNNLKYMTNSKTLAIFDATGARLTFNKPHWETPLGEFNDRYDTENTTRNYERYCIAVYGPLTNLSTDIIDSSRIDGFVSSGIYMTNNYVILKTHTDFYYYNCSNIEITDKHIKHAEKVVVDKNEKNTTTSQFKYTVKGINKKSINNIDDLPIISIGDSFYSNDFYHGSGIQNGVLDCFNLLCIIKYCIDNK